MFWVEPNRDPCFALNTVEVLEDSDYLRRSKRLVDMPLAGVRG
ncbi:MAG TPA: hypothetical protein VFA48_07770 [Gammaproteobacteria bacterium]|nr:hypothetical protein [Gammaproteobacteria bacterium]